MNNDAKILKVLEAIQADVKDLKQDQQEHGTAIAHISTAINALPTKQDLETTVDSAKAELKADILTLEAKVVRKIQSHEKRITNLEEKTETPNPHKN